MFSVLRRFKQLGWVGLVLAGQSATTAHALSDPAINDTSTPINDATVLVNSPSSLGTGTLIAKRLVLTSGHVLPTHRFTQNADWSTAAPKFRRLTQMQSWNRVPDPCCKAAYRDTAVTDNRNILGWDYRSVAGVQAATIAFCRAECAADNQCEAWVIVKPGDPKVGCYLKQAKITISFGPDREHPIYTAKASRWSNAGFDDIAVLHLDAPVPDSVATPARVLSQLPANSGVAQLLLNQASYVMAGWGGGATVRRTWSATFDRRKCNTGDGVVQPNMTCLSSASNAQGGDSGGPAYLIWHGERYVIGALQGGSPFGPGARYVESFGTGGADSLGSTHPDVAQWLDRLLYAAYVAEQPRSRQHAIPLYEWYSEASGDAFTTSGPAWSVQTRGLLPADLGEGFVNAPERSGYVLRRHAGDVFSPHQPQPAGTVPLFSWFNPERGDNLISSAAIWSIPVNEVTWGGRDGESITNNVTRSGYFVFRLEGFIRDPKGPVPARNRGLFSWYNGTLQDNFATTRSDYSMPPGDIEWSGDTISNPPPPRNGYNLFRMEGFVLPRH